MPHTLHRSWLPAPQCSARRSRWSIVGLLLAISALPSAIVVAGIGMYLDSEELEDGVVWVIVMDVVLPLVLLQPLVALVASFVGVRRDRRRGAPPGTGLLGLLTAAVLTVIYASMVADRL